MLKHTLQFAHVHYSGSLNKFKILGKVFNNNRVKNNIGVNKQY